MSTFGKSALKKWDYQFEKNELRSQLQRFNNSPMDIQLAILEKWYPIGMICLRKDHTGFWQEGYTITGYSEHMTYYSVETRRNWNIANIKSVQDGTFPPLVLRPDDNWLKMVNRDNAIEKILGNDRE
jgi:hypothetical protein